MAKKVKRTTYIDTDLSQEAFQINEQPLDLYGTKTNKVKIYSFFAGAGFLDLGFEKQGGYQIQFVNEYCLPFIQTYKFSRVNMEIPEPTYGYSLADISWLTEGRMFDRIKKMVDNDKEDKAPIGFIGGPPCPDFSVGGKNKGRNGENGKLTETYVKMISKLQPDFFLFENVKGLYRTIKHRQFFEEMKQVLHKAGYSLTERLINSLWYGAPQDRERILLIGFRKDSERLGFDVEKTIGNFPWKSNEREDAQKIKTLSWPERTPFKEKSQIPPPSGLPLELTVQYWFDKNKVESHLNAEHCFQPRAGLTKFKVIDEGDDKKKSYKRLHRWRYSPTAAYGNNEVHLHPFYARRISVSEALAIQSLPAEFLVPPQIPLSSMFKTIGNGVPFKVSNGIAKTIADFIAKKGVCP